MRICSHVMGYLKGIMNMPRTTKTTTKTTAKADSAVKKAVTAAEAAPVEVKAAPAAEVKASPAETPKPEAKKPAEKKPAEKKPVEKKAAEKKSAEKKPAAKKPAAKKAAPAKKAAAAKTAKTADAPKKRPGRKPKPVTVEDIVAKIGKRINKDAAKKIAENGKAAVDIKLYGPFEAHMYIEIKDGAVNVAPYDYIEKDIEAAISVENALAIADGKLSVKDAVENGSLYVFGNVQFALMFAKLFN